MTTQKRKETFETTTGKILGYFIFNKTLPTKMGNASSLYNAITTYRSYYKKMQNSTTNPCEKKYKQTLSSHQIACLDHIHPCGYCGMNQLLTLSIHNHISRIG
jgi:hypothetical protein